MARSLDIQIESDWSEMTRVNQVSSEFLESCGLDPELVYRYTMVVCELVENGIKYGVFDGERRQVGLRVRILGKRIIVEVTNPVGPGSRHHLSELDKTVQWVRGFQDPFEAYLDRMRAISREPLEVSKSGLGIVRVTYEGRAYLDFFLDEDNTLSVSAVSAVETS